MFSSYPSSIVSNLAGKRNGGLVAAMQIGRPWRKGTILYESSGFGLRQFSVTLLLPKDASLPRFGPFVAPTPGVHLEDFILHSYWNRSDR
jgi:hypothetical protein